jgi:digeranylgeranylglycerophospholipid reductase
MTETYEAIIIGAGPAGSMAARTLAEQGRRVLILEKSRFTIRKKACGGMLPLACFSQYQLDETVIETRLNDEVLVFPWGTRTQPQPIATVQRRQFDASLANQARQSGATLKEDTRVVRVTRQGKMQLVETVGAIGKQDYQTPLVIFTDGALSQAYKSFGIGFQSKETNTCLGLEYTLDAPENEMKHYTIFFNLMQSARIWSYSWIFPNRDHLNVGFFLPKTDLRRHPELLVALENQLLHCLPADFTDILVNKPLIKKIGANIPMDVARNLVADGALAAGDAAGLVFPLTAGGIGNALWSGKLAGEVASRALLANDCSHYHLREYEQIVKSSGLYREIRKESFLYHFQQKFGSFGRYSYAKIFQVYKLKTETNLFEKIKVILS